MSYAEEMDDDARSQFELDYEGKVFASSYTFAKVMADNPDLARRFAERLLGIKIEKLEFFDVEVSLPAALRKSVRMDAVLAGSDKVVEIEMQTSRDESLERRLRYYQAKIDARSLGRGQRYGELPELFMLAVCRYDHFGTNRALHRFEMRSVDGSDVHFDNGLHVIIANTSADMDDVSEDVRSLLKYVETNVPVEGDDLTMDLAEATTEAYADEGWVGSIMTVDMMLREKVAQAEERAKKAGLERGEKKGLERGLAKGLEQEQARSSALIKAMQGAGVPSDDIVAALASGDREALYAQYGV